MKGKVMLEINLDGLGEVEAKEVIENIEAHEDKKIKRAIRQIVMFSDLFGPTEQSYDKCVASVSMFFKELKRGNDFITLEKAAQINRAQIKKNENTQQFTF